MKVGAPVDSCWSFETRVKKVMVSLIWLGTCTAVNVALQVFVPSTCTVAVVAVPLQAPPQLVKA